MKGIKEVAGLTQHYCNKDGYGIKIQGVYDPVEDVIYGLPQLGGSYLVPPQGQISVWFTRPSTMEQVETAVYDKIAEIELCEKYKAEVLSE